MAENIPYNDIPTAIEVIWQQFIYHCENQTSATGWLAVKANHL